jgi:hypothetical protein
MSPEWATIQNIALVKSTDPIDFLEVITEYRNVMKNSQSWEKPHGTKHSAFSTEATLQGRGRGGTGGNTHERRPCLCGDIHRFSACPYGNESMRTVNWKPKQDIQSQINEKLKDNQSLRDAWKRAIRWRKAETERKTPGKQQDSRFQDSQFEDVTEESAYAITNIVASVGVYSSTLKDSVLLDSAATLHVFNDIKRFQDFRLPGPDDFLLAGKERIPIDGWGTVSVNVRTPEGLGTITLLEVAYMEHFHTNVASLRVFVSKGCHWNTETQQLKSRTGRILAHTPYIENNWILEYNPQLNPSPTHGNSAYVAHGSREPRPDSKGSGVLWHQRMGHLYGDAVSQLPNSATGVELLDKKYDVDCVECRLAHSKRIISRRPRHVATVPFDVLH